MASEIPRAVNAVGVNLAKEALLDFIEYFRQNPLNLKSVSLRQRTAANSLSKFKAGPFRPMPGC